MYSLVLMTMLQSGATTPGCYGCYGAPPAANFRLVLARVDSKGTLLIREVHTGPKLAELTTSYQEKEGEKLPVTLQFQRPRVVEEVLHLDSTIVKVFDTANQAVDPKKLAELLKEETAIVYCDQDKKIEPRLLPALRKGTLIVVLLSPPPVGGHGYNGVVPARPIPEPMPPPKVPLPKPAPGS